MLNRSKFISSENSQIVYILRLQYPVAAWKLIGNTQKEVLKCWLKSEHVIKMSSELDFTKPVLNSFSYEWFEKSRFYTDKQKL